MAALGDYLEQYTFDYLIRLALSYVDDDLDKRQGSIIYDALAPACKELAKVYEELRNIYINTYVMTASGKYLEARVAEQGLKREQPTAATQKGVFTDNKGNPMVIPLGSRFSSIGDNIFTYIVTEQAEEGIGTYFLQCEQAGANGGDYYGDIIPISYLPPLGTAKIIENIIPGADLETDKILRARYIEAINKTAFAGNVQAYDEFLRDIDGVGDAQIYDVREGMGTTVNVSVVGSNYKPVSNDFLLILQELVDPEQIPNYSGSGLGIAPIGHKVKIVTPTAVQMNITTNIILKSGNVPPQAEIEKEISTYIDNIAATWGTPDDYNNYSCTVYLSQIEAAILRAPNVINVTNTKLNGGYDYTFIETAEHQEIPVMGSVVISVG